MLLIRTGGIPDFPAICDLWNSVWPHHHRGVQELLRDQEVLQPDCRPTFWLAEWDGSLVGFAEANRDIASYHPLKWSFGVSVLRDHRGRGIGTELYQTMHKHMESEGLISAMTRISDVDSTSIQFAEKRGYAEVKRDFESELDLAALDLELLKSMAETEVEVKSMAEIDSPDFRRELHEVFEIVRVDTPRVEPPTPLPFDQFELLVLQDPDFLAEGTQIALVDGRIVGFTGIYRAEIEGQLFQWLTAVKREQRGKRVAQALKAKAAQWAIANGYRTVRTDNDTRNAPMLAINDKLGFRRLPGMITFAKRFGSSELGQSQQPPLDSV
jgi:mycothiol synthase